MNILVTGANGQLGNEMRIISKDSSEKYFFTDVVNASKDSISVLKKLAGDSVNTETEHLDITNLTDIRSFVRKYDIEIIVNCAAWTNVDGAEDSEKYALVKKLNETAPENLATAMKEVNGLLVHISTDYVFGGDPYNTPCKENQKGMPTGVYGQTKLQGEQKIQVTGCNFVVLRTAWLYSEFGNNFVKTMLNLTSTKPQLKVVFDQVGTPTYALDLANAISVIIEDYKKGSMTPYNKTGIYHFSNEGVCSWYDFSKMIAEYVGNIGCDIQPCHSSDFPSPVKRPAYSVLDKTKIKDTFEISIPYWVESLTTCLFNIINVG